MKSHLTYLTLAVAIITGCTGPGWDGPAADREETFLCLAISSPPAVKAEDPDETLVTDVNLFVFNNRGVLEERAFLKGGDLLPVEGGVGITRKLLKDTPYDIYVCANLGYPLELSTKEELARYRFYLTYPDEYSRGIPMSGYVEGALSEEGWPITIPLERMMAKISLRIDRTALAPDVRILVRRVTVGGCPRSALLFSESRAETAEEVFATGFTKVYPECDALNKEVTLGMSRECGVYMLENLQGDRLREPVCSYIEIEAEYFSDIYYSGSGQYLIYRFYIGGRKGNYDIRRNCHYHITVRPEGDGLHGDSWSVDMENLGVQESAKVFDLYPAAYNECRSGEDFHFRCDVFPPWTKVYFDEEWLEDESHLYSYTLDEDGHGITLHTRKGGTAMLYISAGAPVYRDTLALLVIDP